MKLLKTLGKNLIAFLTGAVAGIIIGIFYTFIFWIPEIAAKAGLGIIALAPVALIFAVIFGGVAGGITGIVLYFIIRKLKN